MEKDQAYRMRRLAELEAVVLSKPETYAKNGVIYVQPLIAALSEQLADREPRRNPSFDGLEQVAGILIDLMLDAPADFLRLMERFAKGYGRDSTPGTLDSLIVVQTFISGLGDDGEYYLVYDGVGLPKIVFETDLEKWQGNLNPAEMLRHLKACFDVPQHRPEI